MVFNLIGASPDRASARSCWRDSHEATLRPRPRRASRESRLSTRPLDASRGSSYKRSWPQLAHALDRFDETRRLLTRCLCTSPRGLQALASRVPASRAQPVDLRLDIVESPMPLRLEKQPNSITPVIVIGGYPGRCSFWTSAVRDRPVASVTNPLAASPVWERLAGQQPSDVPDAALALAAILPDRPTAARRALVDKSVSLGTARRPSSSTRSGGGVSRSDPKRTTCSGRRSPCCRATRPQLPHITNLANRIYNPGGCAHDDVPRAFATASATGMRRAVSLPEPEALDAYAAAAPAVEAGGRRWHVFLLAENSGGLPRSRRRSRSVSAAARPFHVAHGQGSAYEENHSEAARAHGFVLEPTVRGRWRDEKY